MGSSKASRRPRPSHHLGGEPVAGAPATHGLYVCRLRHTREGDAEIQALCAALGTSALRAGRMPKGLHPGKVASGSPIM